MSGTAEVGREPVPVCPVPANGVLVKNRGTAEVFFGGPAVTADGGTEGFPLAAGEMQVFPGAQLHESPAVPAPAGDMAPPQLYACTAAGAGMARVSWIAAG